MKAFSRIAPVILSITILCVLFLANSVYMPATFSERVLGFTRGLEFDYAAWEWDAIFLKLKQSALAPQQYLSAEGQTAAVDACMTLIDELDQTQREIEQIYADPQISNPQASAHALVLKQESLQKRRRGLEPICESILQAQASQALAEMGLALGGQTLPPLLYHVTPLPLALIVSPRDVIRQDAIVTLLPDLTLEQITMLEQRVERSLGVSALVVEIGGLGTYPPMVASSSNLAWVSDTIVHGWTHNYLNFRPLGWNYSTSGELRTMNETTASIVGGEVGREMMWSYYPDQVPALDYVERIAPPAWMQTAAKRSQAFDYRAEMRATRIAVDSLLAEGKIEEAERYMEIRRQFFWENGYQIRRLNQAYFAFHGAYADSPMSAAGRDPVGPAVRKLRADSDTLAEFLKQISWLASFETLKLLTGEAAGAN